MTDNTRIILGGDVMLGRIVKDVIAKEGINYPMSHIAPIMQRGDLTIVNLECAITSQEQKWSGKPKAFYFGAPPEAAQILKNCGVRWVSVANNHILDYDINGLLETLQTLKKNNIAYAGAGVNLDEALSPVYAQTNNIKFGMVAFCDHQSDFAAQKNSPGMAYLDLDDEDAALKQISSSLATLQNAKVDWPILSLHWGPNMVLRPSEKFVRIAHSAIDMGYKVLFGHSAHVFQGIEIYRNCPIIYAAGDLTDDYYVDPEFKNDHQLLYEIEIANNALDTIKLHPVFISNCQTKPANAEQFTFIEERMKTLCGELGTVVERDDEHFLIIK